MIHIQREHQMSRDDVRKQLDGLAEALKDQFEADFHWEEDTLRFKRTGASGRIEIDDHEVDVAIELGMLFKPFRATVEEAVRNYLDEHLA